ncbi:MAG: hypothetical protein LC792_23130, partial [Actinobacteria bacterium]|nr:hypothetical protein [Actinomycetota bacterium]
GFWLYWRSGDRAWKAKQAEWAAGQEAQIADLARQRHLRELEEHRRGLLRGRDHSCRFCSVEQGCLTPDDLCMDVEACLERGGVTSAATLVV